VALTLLAAQAGCRIGLYSGLNEQEANEMVAALARSGIDAAKERSDRGEDWQVQVDRSRLGAALEVLRGHGLPQDRYASLGDVFQKQGLVSTPTEERMRYVHAVSQELSHTLRSVDGVVAARVHVVVPAHDPLSDKVRPSSAAVFIKHRPDADLRLLGPAVKDLVAHSIEGLSHEQVSLSLFAAQRAEPAGAQQGTGQSDASAFAGLAPRAGLVIAGALCVAAACVLGLPSLLARRRIDVAAWMRRQWRRRGAR
jgi:type III secretion protein J